MTFISVVLMNITLVLEWLLYTINLGIVVSFHGSRIGHVICPSFESHDYIERGFTLTNSTFPLNIFMPDQRLLTDGEYWLPIEEYLKISKREFYDQILSAPASCFVVKDMKP